LELLRWNCYTLLHLLRRRPARGRNHRLVYSRTLGLWCLRGDDRPELAKHDDGVVTLLEARPLDLKLNLLLFLDTLKVGVSEVKVARQQDLHGRKLGVKTNLAAENHRCPEHLTGVRKANTSLELHTEVQTTANQINTAKRVLENGNASVLDITLGNADTLVGCS
jgi:hypothetical protein